MLHSSNYHYIINQLYFYFFKCRKITHTKKELRAEEAVSTASKVCFQEREPRPVWLKFGERMKTGPGESEKSAKNSKKPWEGFNRRQMPSESHLLKVTPATVWVWRMAHKVPRVEGYCKFQVSKDAGLD